MTASDLTLVVVPTYDERENLRPVVDAILQTDPRLHVLVVDDASPDGTGELADELAAADERVHVLHRAGKQGLGSAYLQGFAWGRQRHYERLVEMDADGSHPAEALPALVAAVRDGGADLAIGSRWVPGGAVVDWPLHREVLSRAANTYARLALGIHVRDSTAGFRVYDAKAYDRLDLRSVHSRGYIFQIDMTLHAADAGQRIVEVPITFRDRTVGESKMSGSIVREAMWKVTVWGLQRLPRRARRWVRRARGLRR